MCYLDPWCPGARGRNHQREASLTVWCGHGAAGDATGGGVLHGGLGGAAAGADAARGAHHACRQAVPHLQGPHVDAQAQAH
eukprot:2765207-Rhodomonas_salina.1